MSTPGTRRLAEAIEELLRDRDVSIQHIVDTVGVARNTITALRRERIHHPDPELLRRIAEGFATDKGTGVVDDFEREHVWGVLNAAIGYADPAAQQTETLLELGLHHRYKSVPRARACMDLYRAVDALPTSAIRELERLARAMASGDATEP